MYAFNFRLDDGSKPSPQSEVFSDSFRRNALLTLYHQERRVLAPVRVPEQHGRHADLVCSATLELDASRPDRMDRVLR